MVRLSFLLEKQLWMKFSFDTQQIYANVIVRIDASQLYPYVMSQTMQHGLFTRWDIDSETRRFTPRKDKTRSLRKTVISYFQRRRPGCKDESFHTTGRQKEVDCCSGNGFCSNSNIVFEAMVCFHHFVLVDKCVHRSLKRISNTVARNKNSMN